MLLTYLDRPLAVNCDWLSYSVRIKPNAIVVNPPEHHFELVGDTNVYKERWVLYDKCGAKVMTLCAKPKSSLIKEDIATCQIANPWLYNPDPMYWESLIGSFYGATYNGLSRWDVCLDFNPTDAEFKTIRKLLDGSQYVQAKSEGDIYWHTENYKGVEFRQPHCFHWGSPQSMLRVKLYNKSREINATNVALCTKPYILAEWDGHLDTTSVWRLEFSLCDVNQFNIDGHRMSLADAVNADIMCRFMSMCKNKRFVVRMNQGRRQGHKNEDEIVPFLPFEIGNIKFSKALALSSREPLDEMKAMARQLMIHIADPSVRYDAFRLQSMSALLLNYAETPEVLYYLNHLAGGSFINWYNNLNN